MSGVGLRRRVGQGLLVVIQLAQPGFHLVDAHSQLFRLGIQAVQFVDLSLQGIPLRLCLGEQSAAVIAAAVFQVLQLRRQPVSGAAFISGGHQRVQAAAQSLVLGHRQVRVADESRPAEHRLLHAQQHLAAVGRCQLAHGQARFRFIGPELSQWHPALGPALDGDVPAVPAQIDAALHGAAGPGSVVLLVCQRRPGGLGPGVQAIEHGDEKGAPGAFAPFVGGGDDIQPRLQGQRLMLQLAEGGGHSVNFHSVTSRPASSFREISAASWIRPALSGSSSIARRSRWK